MGRVWIYNLKEKCLHVLSQAQCSWDTVWSIPPTALVITLSSE